MKSFAKVLITAIYCLTGISFIMFSLINGFDTVSQALVGTWIYKLFFASPFSVKYIYIGSVFICAITVALFIIIFNRDFGNITLVSFTMVAAAPIIIKGMTRFKGELTGQVMLLICVVLVAASIAFAITIAVKSLKYYRYF
jgi:hypothetical protein